jgi:two-component system cell cycle response regulator DivK
MHMRSRTILVVDDEPEERTIFASYLQFVGGTTVEANNGEEALDFAREVQPDLILLDITMPVLDGWGTMEELQRSPETANIPVIAVTAHQLDAHQLEGAGFCGYLEKPISPHRVLEEVERCVGRLAVQDAASDAEVTTMLAGGQRSRRVPQPWS